MCKSTVTKGWGKKKKKPQQKNENKSKSTAIYRENIVTHCKFETCSTAYIVQYTYFRCAMKITK